MALVQGLAYKDFDTHVLKSSVPVVVHFGTSRCPPCRELAPVLEEIADFFKGRAAFFTIDLDKDHKAFRDYITEVIPTAILFQNGKEVKRATNGVAIVDMLEELAIQLMLPAEHARR